MIIKVKTDKGQGDWRLNLLVPRAGLWILALMIIIDFAVIMGITGTYKFVDLLLLAFVS